MMSPSTDWYRGSAGRCVEDGGEVGDVFCGIVGSWEGGKLVSFGGRGEYTGGGVCGTTESLWSLFRWFLIDRGRHLE